MERPLLREQTPAEYFKELVEESLTRQHLTAGDLTEYYLVNLLCQYVRLDVRGGQSEHEQPLAIRLVRALESAGAEQRSRLRRLGDHSLFMSGFFSDSFRRRPVDVDYYKSMGEYAYGSLSRSDDEAFADVFAELARKFVGYMDVFTDISERTSVAGRPDALRLYERWLRTGSAQDGQRLVESGILPNYSLKNRLVQ